VKRLQVSIRPSSPARVWTKLPNDDGDVVYGNRRYLNYMFKKKSKSSRAINTCIDACYNVYENAGKLCGYFHVLLAVHPNIMIVFLPTWCTNSLF